MMKSNFDYRNGNDEVNVAAYGVKSRPILDYCNNMCNGHLKNSVHHLG